MNFSAQLTLSEKKEIIKAYYDALEPEQNQEGRASYKLTLKNSTLIINIQAQDTTMLRAVTNSVLSMIAIVDKTVNGA